MQEIQEMQVQLLGWEDPLEKGMAAHSSILAWRIPMDRGAWWATVHEVTKSRTQLSDLARTHPFPYTCMSPGWDSRVPASGSESVGALLNKQILRPQLDLLKEHAHQASQTCREEAP